MSVPIGLQYGRNPGSIRNLSQATDSSGKTIGLQVQPGKTLALVGGNLSLDGGSLKAQGGRVEIAGVAGPGMVGLNVDSNGLRLSFPDSVPLADVTLNNGAILELSSNDVQLLGKRVTLTNGSQIVANTLGIEPGGTLTVNASDSVQLIGSSALSTQALSTGNGGDLRINTGKLIVRDGAQISTSVYGAGSGGNLTVNALESVDLSGISANGQFSSGLFSSSFGAGNAGDLRINTGRLVVQDGAQLNVSSKGSGNAGNLDVEARSILLDNQAAFKAESTFGEGGNIKLLVQDLLLLRRNSQISISDNLAINTGFLIASENSDIILNLKSQGRGGSFLVNTQLFLLSPDSDIILDSGEPLELPESVIDLGLVPLPTNLVDASQQIDTSCTPGSRQRVSSFVITGRGGIPPSPLEMLTPDAVQVDLVTLPNREAQHQEKRGATGEQRNTVNYTHKTDSVKSSTKIVEAQGWIVDANGDVVLVAQAATAKPHNPLFNPPSCHAS